MTSVQAILIRGSEKVIDHYRRLLSRAATEDEREIYLDRIGREQRLLDRLRRASSERAAA